MSDYKEITTTIGELKDGDLVFGTDGEWHTIEILPVENKTIYRISFNNGSVDCSFDHEWVFPELNERVRTVEILENINKYRGRCVGKLNSGVYLIDINELGDDNCRCITVDSEDHQFQILTDEGNEVFTCNCQGRIVCGRLDTTASLMALGNSLATGIDGEHKGAGIVFSQGTISNIQYYYEDHEWLNKWYRDRGMDNNGFEIGYTEEEIAIELEGEEEFSLKDEDKLYQFGDMSKEVTNRKEQKFEEV